MTLSKEFRDSSQVKLVEATAQEIQLELLRRTQHNALDGHAVLQTLLKHPELWTAVLLDRLHVSSHAEHLPILGMIKLRDLPHNDWNADTLYILSPTIDSAQELKRAIDTQDWGGEVQIHSDPEDVGRTLGSSGDGEAIITVWWD
jgi:hypothetical protein